jgi:tetratricopeptide (TPR) repeat protein
MPKAIKRYGVLLVVNFFVFSALTIYGQDLGSSNGLFRATNPKPKTNAARKTPPKKAKPTADKPAAKTTPRKNENTASKSVKPANKSAKNNNSKASAKQTEPIKDVVITIGKSEPANLDELYENSIEEGNLARDRREYGAAETAYVRAKAVKLKEKDFRAVYGLGNIYSDQQRWEEAEEAYREAVALSPDSPEPYVAISFVLTQPIIGKDLSVRFLEAQKMARRAIELDPGNPIAYNMLGVALELSGNIDKTTEDAYRRAVALDPEFALAYAHLGRLLRRNGRVNESSQAYRRAIELARDVPTMIMVADVLQSQQRYAESEKLLRQALREDGRNPTALYLLGRALTASASFVEAEAVLKKSIEISPKSLVSYMLLGSVHARRKDFNKAEAILIKALQIVSENEKKRLAQEFEAVGDGFMTTGKRKDAVRAYQQAIALDTEKSILKDKLARAGEVK